jgi:hypothetical protein
VPRGLVFGSISNATNLEGNSAVKKTPLWLWDGLGDANDGIGLQITQTTAKQTPSIVLAILASKLHAGSKQAGTDLRGLALDRLGGWEASEPILRRPWSSPNLLTSPLPARKPAMMSIGAGIM